jgi:hypothetical protein
MSNSCYGYGRTLDDFGSRQSQQTCYYVARFASLPLFLLHGRLYLLHAIIAFDYHRYANENVEGLDSTEIRSSVRASRVAT